MNHKVFVLGANQVGKSSLKVYLLFGIDLECRKRMIVNEERLEFLKEPAPSFINSNIRTGFGLFNYGRPQLKKSNAIIIVFSLVVREGFEDIKNYRQEILTLKEKRGIPILLVGNKVDLCLDNRIVSKAEAIQLALQLGLPYRECSATSKTGLESVFELLFYSLPESNRRKTKSRSCLPF